MFLCKYVEVIYVFTIFFLIMNNHFSLRILRLLFLIGTLLCLVFFFTNAVAGGDGESSDFAATVSRRRTTGPVVNADAGSADPANVTWKMHSETADFKLRDGWCIYTVNANDWMIDNKDETLSEVVERN